MPGVTLDRAQLVTLLSPGGLCSCGSPAVVRYQGSWTDGAYWWPRCGTCPGASATSDGHRLVARPMERYYRRVLALLGDEEVFLAAVRLGHRPTCHLTGVACEVDASRWDASHERAS